MQLSLLDNVPPDFDRAFTQARRVRLGPRAWVEHVPGWLVGQQRVLSLVSRSADWQLHRRQMYDRIVDVPRLVAGMPGKSAPLFGDEVTVAVQPRSASDQEFQEANLLLERMSKTLGDRYGRALNRVSLAWYRDGKDSVAFHGDKLGPLRKDTVVAIVSVGCRRRFLMRPALSAVGPGDASEGGARERGSLSFSVGEGDLLVMGGDCQETWEHAIPKAVHAGPRIAIMFREKMPMALANTKDSQVERLQPTRIGRVVR